MELKGLIVNIDHLNALALQHRIASWAADTSTGDFKRHWENVKAGLHREMMRESGPSEEISDEELQASLAADFG